MPVTNSMSPLSSPATLKMDIDSATSPSETNAIYVTLKSDKTKNIGTLIDSGSSVCFLDSRFALQNNLKKFRISANRYDSPSLTVHLLLVVFCTNTPSSTLSSHARPTIPSASYLLCWIARLKPFLDTCGCTSTIR